MWQIKKMIVRIRRFIVYRVLHIDDTPQRLALGIALGLFIAWTPTVGIQMFLVLILAPALRANAAVGIPMVWLSNPFTIIPIYFSNYWLGNKFLNLFTERPYYNYSQFGNYFNKYMESDSIFTQMTQADFWHKVVDLAWTIGLDLCLGSALIGIIIAVIGYFIGLKLIVWYRTHTPRGRLHVLKMVHKKKNAS